MNEEQRVEVVESYVKRVAERAGEYWNRALDSGVAMAIKLAMEKELDVVRALAAPQATPQEAKPREQKFCYSCGLTWENHVEGGYAIGRDGNKCRAFVFIPKGEPQEAPTYLEKAQGAIDRVNAWPDWKKKLFGIGEAEDGAQETKEKE